MEKIILASSSPRRKEILSKHHVAFEVATTDIQENFCQHDTKEQIAMSLALLKALDVEKKRDHGIIIAADTLVYKNNVFGKPKDEADAFSMLKTLSGGCHHVITGVALIRSNTFEKMLFYDLTNVYFKELTDDEILSYIDTDEIWGKAGSYAIQGKGADLIEKIEGDYYNVMGLPFQKMKWMMEKYFHVKW
ncbi:MAG: Maf family protein [Peptostreptococcales bacterium]